MRKTLDFFSGSILLFCVFSLVAKDPPQTEHVQERVQAQVQPKVVCFAKAEAAKEILNDANDPYFNRLQLLEISAKTGKPLSTTSLDEARELARRHYSEHVLEFSEAEKKGIEKVVGLICQAVSRDAALLVRTPWKFLKVDATVEGGLPHTRHDFIVLSERTLKRHFANAEAPEDSEALHSAAELFLHEQFHVLQRMKPGIFDGIYTKVWGFTKAQHIEEDPWILERQLVNPDGIDVHWVVEIKGEKAPPRWVWPLITIRKPEVSGDRPRMPQDFVNLAVALEKTGEGRFKVKLDEYGHPEYTNLYDDEGYMARFDGQRSNLYHPHEAAASIFASLLMEWNVAWGGESQQQRLQALKKFARIEKPLWECLR